MRGPFLNLDDMQCHDVLACFYNLNQLEVECYKKLVKVGASSPQVIAEHVVRERSTVYRALNNLVSVGLVTKNTELLKEGGYFHNYSAKSPKKVREELERSIDDWTSRMKQALEDLSSIEE